MKIEVWKYVKTRKPRSGVTESNGIKMRKYITTALVHTLLQSVIFLQSTLPFPIHSFRSPKCHLILSAYRVPYFSSLVLVRLHQIIFSRRHLLCPLESWHVQP